MMSKYAVSFWPYLEDECKTEGCKMERMKKTKRTAERRRKTGRLHSVSERQA